MNLQKIIRNRTYYQNRLKIILSYLNLKGKSVLDLGCGEMILLDLVKNEISSYVGIDNCVIPDKPQFVRGNILDDHILKEYSADFVFLLGVLDHLNLEEKEHILKMCKDKFKVALIITQRNPGSFLNLFYRKKSPVVKIEKLFNNHTSKKIYLLKFPLSKKVIDLSQKYNWVKKLSTEIVYFIGNH
jgi:hypothetical protein